MLDLVLWRTRVQPPATRTRLAGARRSRVTAQSRPSRCPSCGASGVSAILYGLPVVDEELDRDLDAGRIALGGCCVWEGMPSWRCSHCHHEWGDLTNGELERAKG